MFTKQHSKPQNRIDTLVGVGTKIDGNIQFSGGLRVDGEINGNIIAAPDKPSTLVLSEQAQVNGEIHVTHLVINGTVTGPVLTIFSFQPATWPSSLNRLVTKRNRSASVPFAVQNRSWRKKGGIAW